MSPDSISLTLACMPATGLHDWFYGIGVIATIFIIVFGVTLMVIMFAEALDGWK